MPRATHVRHLQRGRGGPRCVHGPQHDRVRSSCGARRDAASAPMRSAPHEGYRLHPERVPDRPGAPADVAIDTGPEYGLARERTFSAGVSTSTSGSSAAPARSSAANRRRSWRRSKGRPGEPRAKYVHTVETRALGQAHLPEQRRDLGERPADHPEAAPRGSPASGPATSPPTPGAGARERRSSPSRGR